MKKKLFGIFICMLFIATAIPSFGLAMNITNEKTPSEFTYIIEEMSNSFDTIGMQNDDEIDQQQTTNSGSERIQYLAAGLGQSFVPAATPLTKVSILLTKPSGHPLHRPYPIF